MVAIINMRRSWFGGLIAVAALILAGPAVRAETRPATPTAKEPPPPPIRETFDIPYGKAALQQLDVFAPEKGKDYPVVLFVHGGTWMLCDKDFYGLYRGVGKFLARHGVVAVSINYRLSPAVKHPAHVEDVARAFAWTRRHVAAYGGDPDRIILMGHSAGGHLVSLLATDPRYLKDPALRLSAADRAALRGVISVSGVYSIPNADEFSKTMAAMIQQMLPVDRGSGVAAVLMPLLIRGSKEFDFFRVVFGKDPNVSREASPLAHVRKGLPPFLLLYATPKDYPTLAEGSRTFAAALKKAGDQVEVRPIAGRNHESIMFRINGSRDPVGQAVLKFVARYAGKR